MSVEGMSAGMKDKLVSVVIATYNRAEMVVRCVESVLKSDCSLVALKKHRPDIAWAYLCGTIVGILTFNPTLAR